MKKKKTSATLVVISAVYMVVMTLFGFLLKSAVFDGRELYRDTPVPALPYVFLFDTAFHEQLRTERFLEEQQQEVPPPSAEIAPPEEDVGGSTPESAPPEQEETQAPMPPVYVKGVVEPSYFADALFIGDSRTDGLYLYSPFEGADYFSGKGMTVFGVFDKASRDGDMLADLLGENTYGKIYIMLGINELGSDMDLLVKQYAAVILRLRELAPTAIIVIQGNLSVDEKTSSSTWYLTAERIHTLNSKLSALADNTTTFYLDPNPTFCDQNGFLNPDMSGDGIHLYAKHYTTWTDWLCENAFVGDVLG